MRILTQSQTLDSMRAEPARIMSVTAVVATLRAINPRDALRVALPASIIEAIAPQHDAILRAATRQQRRLAWREWDKAVESLVKVLQRSN